MKNTKLTVKFFLILSLFASNVLADGQMNGGGLTDDGQMNGGGKACNPQTQTCVTCNPQTQTCRTANPTDDENGEDSIFAFVRDYLASLLG